MEIGSLPFALFDERQSTTRTGDLLSWLFLIDGRLTTLRDRVYYWTTRAQTLTYRIGDGVAKSAFLEPKEIT